MMVCLKCGADDWEPEKENIQVNQELVHLVRFKCRACGNYTPYKIDTPFYNYTWRKEVPRGFK